MKRLIATLIIAGICTVPQMASAGLLSKLGRLANDAGDAGRKIDGIGGTGVPTTALRAAKGPNGTAAVLSINDAGDIRLIDELGRATGIRTTDDIDVALKSLGTKEVSVVSDVSTLGKDVAISKELAKRGVLKIWHDDAALPVRISNGGLAAEIRPNIIVPILTDSDIITTIGRPFGSVRTSGLREVRYAFDKPLNRGTVVVAQIDKGPKGPRKVGFGESVQPGETLTVTKDELVHGLSSNRGGTVVLAGRIDGEVIRTSLGSVSLADVQTAASAADVHLVLMNGSTKAAHKVIAKSDTYGDLILGLSANKMPMIAQAARDGPDRVRFIIRPEVKEATPANVGGDIDVALGIGHLAGHAGSTAVDFFTPDKNEEEDRGMRILPWFTFDQHLFVVGTVLFGFLGHRPAWWFWRKIWILPTSSRAWRIARGVGYAVFMFFTGIFWGIIRYLFGWIAWFVPAWRKPKTA